MTAGTFLPVASSKRQSISSPCKAGIIMPVRMRRGCSSKALRKPLRPSYAQWAPAHVNVLGLCTTCVTIEEVSDIPLDWEELSLPPITNVDMTAPAHESDIAAPTREPASGATAPTQP